MSAVQINTPRRVAAFLTTLCFESYCEYSILQGGTNVPLGFVAGSTKNYTGRGYIQLTGSGNYDAAGKYFGIDLLGHPELAQSLQWSAKIATWYWTVNRHSNAKADVLDMGGVNRDVGYPRDATGTNDNDRCLVFGEVLEKLTGEPVSGIDCTR